MPQHFRQRKGHRAFCKDNYLVTVTVRDTTETLPVKMFIIISRAEFLAKTFPNVWTIYSDALDNLKDAITDLSQLTQLKDINL